MQTFLNQPEATFYHVTTIDKWNIIKESGIKSSSSRIFVSRVGELPILLSIAFEQLPEIYEADELVFLKLPQAKNNFLPDEIVPDLQASVEWTQKFQNIILRDYIPIENIEIMMSLKLGDEPNRTFIISYFTQMSISASFNYKDHLITTRSTEIVYYNNQ